jgi:LmbE family N-acetylglucosaminyl deacetylase
MEECRLLIIGAHVGDADLTAGCLAAKHSDAGHKVFLAHMTLGERGHPTLSQEEYAVQKKTEAENVARSLGAEVFFLPYRDGELPVSDEVKFRLCDLIRELRPDIVVTHWGRSTHKDHANTYLNVKDAVFYAGLPAIKRDLPAHAVSSMYYAENWEDPYGFRPQVYVDISDVFQRWRKAMQNCAFARGETGFPYIEYYSNLFRIRGIESGFKLAQSFMMPSRQSRLRVARLPILPLGI